jgi:hypothetical protein
MLVLSLIFLPKVWMQRRYAAMSKSEQRKAMLVSVQRSGGGGQKRRVKFANGSNVSGLEATELSFGFSAKNSDTASLDLSSEEMPATNEEA